MRCFAAPVAAGPARPLPVDRNALDAVRHLVSRFPHAALREVALVRAFELDRQADPSGCTRVWLALEMLQVTGSFKVRGALVSLDANRVGGHVVAAGAHNHGIAVAYAASILDLTATVCVPRGTSRDRCDKVQKYGAELVVAAGERDEDAEILAQEIAAARGATFVSADDDLDVVLGSGASLGFEIVRALGGIPERVLVPFSRGGLATGLAWALAAETDAALGTFQGPGPAADGAQLERGVWGVESGAACTMAWSIERGGSYRERPHGASLSVDAYTRAVAAIAGIIVTSDACIMSAAAHAHRDLGLLVESRAAAALAPVLFGLPEPVRGGDLVVVLTGRNVEGAASGAVGESAVDGGL